MFSSDGSVQGARTDWAPTVLVSPQPINALDQRASRVYRNWLDLLQFSLFRVLWTGLREGTAATCCRKVTSLCRPSATWLTTSITRLSLSPCDTQLITPKSYSSLANVPLRDSCCNCRTHGTNFVFDTIIMGSRQMSSQVAGTSAAARIRHQYYRIN